MDDRLLVIVIAAHESVTLVHKDPHALSLMFSKILQIPDFPAPCLFW